MLIAKTIAILLAGVFTVVVFRRVMATFEAAKARVNPVPDPPPLTKLRQDPRTGIYHPET
jgi:hypothetical protein